MNVDLFEMKTEDLKSNQNLILNDSDNQIISYFWLIQKKA